MSIEIECFYRLLPQMHSEGCDDEPEFHYNSFDIFVLETRLYPLIYKLLPNKNLQIYLMGKYDEGRNKMVLHLEIEELVYSTNPNIPNEKVTLTPYQTREIKKKIAEITSENVGYALIDINELYENSEKEYSKSWMYSVLPYVGLNTEYNPFIRSEGIYLTFNPLSDYLTAYRDVCDYILYKLDEFYHNGVVVLNDVLDNIFKETLIQNWKLEPLDVNENIQQLYQPTWTDFRFARNITDFMMEKISGDPYIRFNISDNYVVRHFIAKLFQENNKGLSIEGSVLKTVSTNIDEALNISALVEAGEGLAKGRVVIMMVPRLSYIYLFNDYAMKKYEDNKDILNTVSYMTNDKEPYTFSILLPENEYTPDEELRKEFYNFALDRLIETSKIVKLKNKSPHDIIEEEYK